MNSGQLDPRAKWDIPLQKCTLRPLRMADAPSIALRANSEKVTRFVRDRFPYPYRLEDAESFIQIIGSKEPPECLAIVVGGEAVGAAGVIPGEDIHRRSAEIGFWIGEAFWNRGIVTEAVKGLVEYSFRQFDIVRLYAEVFAPNVASARVLERVGFVLEARMRSAICKRGVIYDGLLYALVRDR